MGKIMNPLKVEIMNSPKVFWKECTFAAPHAAPVTIDNTSEIYELQPCNSANI